MKFVFIFNQNQKSLAISYTCVFCSRYRTEFQTVLKKSLKIQLHLYPRTMLWEGKINKKECVTYDIFFK